MAIRDCEFPHLGAGGVVLDGGDRATPTPGGNLVAHCRFDNFGRLKRTYAPGVSVQGVGNTVTRSLFFNAPHSAILFGGNEHRITENRIHSVLLETGDCGAIDGGRDWTTHGTRITGNAFVACGPTWHQRDAAAHGATLAPNIENLAAATLAREGRRVAVAGTPLVFTIPEAGPRLTDETSN